MGHAYELLLWFMINYYTIRSHVAIKLNAVSIMTRFWQEKLLSPNTGDANIDKRIVSYCNR